MSLKRIIKHPKYILCHIDKTGIIRFSDEIMLKIKYEMLMNRKLNLETPKSFNEKLQWLKLYDRKDIYTTMVDKYEAKKYVAKIIGNEYLIPTIGVYEKFEDINFEELPKQFVLKCTHDSGGVIVCKDKEKLDIKNIKKRINRNLSKNFYYEAREWPYKNVKPRIIIEKYMEDKNERDLKDYKFMCFNGKVKCSFICSERDKKDGLKIDFYDLEWNKMPFRRHYPNSKTLFEKPKNYELMIQFAEKLSTNIPFLRVDFYEVNGKLYFGELTFFPGGGYEEFTPEEYDNILGDWLELPKRKGKK